MTRYRLVSPRTDRFGNWIVLLFVIGAVCWLLTVAWPVVAVGVVAYVVWDGVRYHRHRRDHLPGFTGETCSICRSLRTKELGRLRAAETAAERDRDDIAEYARRTAER